jgi:hypothetical protein
MTQLTAAEIAKEHGFSARHWTRLAAGGKVPGARQPAGTRGQWLFDAVVFRRWWSTRIREVEAWPGYTAGAERTGAAPSVVVESTGEASRRLIEQRLSAVLGNGSVTSKPSNGATSRGARLTKRQTSSSAST